jgi:hypothetical protein
MKSAQKILEEWIAEINNLDVSRISKLYSEDAQLLPTFSSKPLIGREEISGYFDKFTKHESVTVELHPNSITVRDLSGGVALVSGLYCWNIDMDGERLNFEARFSFLIVAEDEGPIKHHHSSQIPRSI